MTGEFLPDQLDLSICHRALALFLTIALFFAVAIARGSGPKNVIFLNGPNFLSECSKLLY